MTSPIRRALHSAKEYKIAWITALEIELAAAIALLDEHHYQPKDFVRCATDDNVYTWGHVSGHNVAIACLPDGQYGLSSATTTVEKLISSLPHIKVGLLVGIGAGITTTEDIRLGDVAVSRPEGMTGGVIQYDFGKAKMSGIGRIGMLSAPPRVLLNALKRLRAEHELHEPKISTLLQQAMQLNPKFAKSFGFPGIEKDYFPRPSNLDDASSAVKISPRSTLNPSIYYGTIASGNLLVKDSKTRDELIAVLGQPCICLEMEAGGLMNNFPCLVIRGICDYADSNKNDDWQRYASATATAFAKELLQYVPTAEIERTDEIQMAIEGVHTDVRRLDAGASHSERKAHEEKALKCIQYLFLHHHTERKDRNPKRVENTCKWFTEHRLFQDWISGIGSQTLWVSADPGCGKSVLARYLVDEVLPCQNRAVCFFFFKDDFSDQRTGAAAARTMLHQLFCGDQTLLTEAIMKTIDTYGIKFGYSFSIIWRVLLEAVQNLSGDLICVFDALDECIDEDRSEIVRAICGSDHFPTLPTRIKIIALSRPYFNIKNHFESIVTDVPILHLSGDNDQEREIISTEIDLVIKHRIEVFCKRRLLDQKDHDLLLAKLISTPQKTYLWAHLTLAFLEDTPGFTRGNARQLCEHLPPTVDAAYEKILNRSIDKAKTRLILDIVIAAKRPISVHEMCLLLALDGTQTKYEQLEEFIEPEDRFKDTVRELCGLFLIVVDRKIYLLHQTAREFLLAETAQECKTTSGNSVAPRWPVTNDTNVFWKHKFLLSASNYTLAERCVWFLTIDKYDLDGSFFYYCVVNWHEHIRHSNINSQTSLADRIYHNLLTDSTFCRSWWSSHNNKGTRYSTHSEISNDIMWGYLTDERSSFSFKMACFYGLLPLVKIHLDGKWMQSWSVETLSQALWFSFCSKDTGTIETLIRFGSDPNRPCIPTSRDRWKFDFQFPLYLAIAHRLNAVIELLLHHGAEVNSLNSHYDETNITPLHAAIRYQLEESTIMKLVEHGADIRMVDSRGKDALTRFYSAHHGDICPELLRVSLWGEEWNNVDRYDENHRTALSYAAENNCLACVQDLLQRKASVNSRDTKGKTPFLYAISAFWRYGNPIVAELLNAGADIHVKDNDGNSAILIVAKEEAAAVGLLRLLHDAGADVRDVNIDGSTCLHLVKNPEVFEELISWGLDINTRDKRGMTPLLALFPDWKCPLLPSQHLRLASAMLKHGANAGDVDYDGCSIIMHYSARKHHGKRTSKCLRLHDMLSLANPNYLRGRSSNGFTALHHLAWSGGCLVCGETLLKNGTDINVRDKEGCTPLATASLCVARLLYTPPHDFSYYGQLEPYSRRKKVMSWLLRAGADVNLANIKGDIPLHLVLPDTFEDLNYPEEFLESYMEIPKTLIKHGAIINAQNNEGTTPLMKLCLFKGIEVEALKFMLSNGADPRIKDNNRWTALSHLKGRLESPAFSDSEQFRACVELLEEAERRNESNEMND